LPSATPATRPTRSTPFRPGTPPLIRARQVRIDRSARTSYDPSLILSSENRSILLSAGLSGVRSAIHFAEAGVPSAAREGGRDPMSLARLSMLFPLLIAGALCGCHPETR